MVVTEESNPTNSPPKLYLSASPISEFQVAKNEPNHSISQAASLPLGGDRGGILSRVERVTSLGDMDATSGSDLLLPRHRKRRLETDEEVERTLRKVSQYPIDMAPPPEQLLAQLFKKPSSLWCLVCVTCRVCVLRLYMLIFSVSTKIYSLLCNTKSARMVYFLMGFGHNVGYCYFAMFVLEWSNEGVCGLRLCNNAWSRFRSGVGTIYRIGTVTGGRRGSPFEPYTKRLVLIAMWIYLFVNCGSIGLCDCSVVRQGVRRTLRKCSHRSTFWGSDADYVYYL